MPWALAAPVEAASINRLNRLYDALDAVPVEAARAFMQLGLRGEAGNRSDRMALERADSLISLIPDLWEVVATRVDSIAILDAADSCFDVSHSDPAWPGLILVSIPPPTSVGDLRLAEGIIHEAMHHHLSAFEANIALVGSLQKMYSPWKGCERPVGGVLHGIYVFGCIAEALRQWLDKECLDRQQSLHAKSRIAEIGEELLLIDHEALLATLTDAGQYVHMLALNAVQWADSAQSTHSVSGIPAHPLPRT